MRGYLWSCLQVEVIDEFASFGMTPSRGELVKAGFAIKRWKERPLIVAQPAPLRNRRHYARAVAAGQCVKGAHPARPGKKTCADCSAKATAKTQARRKAKAA
jgi:hypothetical protein